MNKAMMCVERFFKRLKARLCLNRRLIEIAKVMLQTDATNCMYCSNVLQIGLMSRKDFERKLACLKNAGYIVWNVEDVISALKEQNPLIDEDEAQCILQAAISNHDCSIGVTWETFDYYADYSSEDYLERMVDQFPYSLEPDELDWLDIFMTREQWDEGGYTKLILDSALSINPCDFWDLQKLIQGEIYGHYAKNPAYYYHRPKRFAADNCIALLEEYILDLTAMFVRRMNEEAASICEA